MIRNIVFDFGNVLVNYDFDLFLKSIFGDRKEEMAAFKAVACTPENMDRYDKGDQPFPEVVADLCAQYPQWEPEWREFTDRHVDVVLGEVPGMRDLISRLREAGYGIYGLSNWSCIIYQVMERFDILSVFDGRVISSEEKLIKPDEAIYHRLCDKYHLREEECLFIDDKLENVEGARRAGMSSLLFTDAAHLEEELQQVLCQPAKL